MPDWRERLYAEHTELTLRIDKLKDFVFSSEEFLELSSDDQTDLLMQLYYMKQYASVLSRRAGRLTLGDIKGQISLTSGERC
jgi:hypothetical protein